MAISKIALQTILARKKAIIFDMDGTMVDNLRFHVDGWVAYLQKIGIEVPYDELYTGLVHRPLSYLSKLLGIDGNSVLMKQIEAEKEIHYRALYQTHIKEIPGLTAFLDELKKRNYKIALATLGNAENVAFTLNHLKVLHYFDAITKREDVAKGKPDPEVFITSLKKLNVQATEALIFEDSEAGVLGAMNAGIDVIGVETSNTSATFAAWGAIASTTNYLFE